MEVKSLSSFLEEIFELGESLDEMFPEDDGRSLGGSEVGRDGHVQEVFVDVVANAVAVGNRGTVTHHRIGERGHWKDVKGGGNV